MLLFHTFLLHFELSGSSIKFFGGGEVHDQFSKGFYYLWLFVQTQSKAENLRSECVGDAS